MAFQASRASVRIGTAPWLSQSSIREWARVFTANITGRFILKKLLASMIPKRYGHFTNVGSLAGPSMPLIIGPRYAETKAAPVEITGSVAQDLAPHGIPVNGIAPEQVLCDLNGPSEGAANRSAISWILVGRFGMVEEPALVAAAFMISPSAYGVTGRAFSAQQNARRNV